MAYPRILNSGRSLIAVASIMLASSGVLPSVSHADEQGASAVAFRPAGFGNQERSADPSEQQSPMTSDSASTLAFRPAEGTGGSFLKGVPAEAMAFAPAPIQAGERRQSADTASTLAIRPEEERK
jgi:hypothetical protein